MWRSWIDSPPQIPWAPVETWNPAHDTGGILCRWDMRPEFNIANLLWRPTGIYREEFWQTTGRWI